MDLRSEDLDDLLNKQVVVTHKDEQTGSDSQILQGTLEQVELASNPPNLPMRLLVRNESGELIKLKITDVEDIREGD